MGHDAAATAAPDTEPRLLRIQEVAAETGLTPRSIRYYEEMGLLAPAARSEGAYRLYDTDDLERLRFIGGLRNDAGFSLAEIGQMLEDEQARSRNRVQFRAGAPADQRAALTDAIDRIDRQLATLARKRDRLDAMIADAATRRAHLRDHLADLEAGRSPDHAPHAGPPTVDAGTAAAERTTLEEGAEPETATRPESAARPDAGTQR